MLNVRRYLWVRLFLLLLPLVAMAGVAGALLWASGDRINPRNFGSIERGMTETEVRSLLRRGADFEYRPWDVATYLRAPEGCNSDWEKIWVGKNWVIILQFDSKGDVCTR